MTELKNFIETALVEIHQAVKAAREQTKEAVMLSWTDGVEFDVAVTATKEAGKNAGLNVVAATILSGGAKAEQKTTDQEVSRIKFKVLLETEA
jgi:hypothetical protein